MIAFISAIALAVGIGGATSASAAGNDPARQSAVQAATSSPAAMNADGLKQTDSDQQRWLSAPNSRMVLQPYDYPRGGTELSQHDSGDAALDVGFFAHDDAIRLNNVLRVQQETTVTAQTEDNHVTAFTEDFNDAQGWDIDQVSVATTGGLATIATDDGKEWGSIKSPTIKVNDISDARYLTVKVTSVTKKWNVKINDPATGADFDTLFQADSAKTGTFTFDIAKTLGWSGAHSFRVRLWATGGSGASATFDSVTVSGWAQPFVDNFAQGGWASSTNGATMSGNTLTIPSGDGWGAVAKTVTVADIAATPLLTVDVAQTSAKWALKIRKGSSGSDLSPNLIADTDKTGKITVNLAETYGLSGSQTFEIRLFQVGTQGSTTTFNSVSIHTGATPYRNASVLTTTWSPYALTFTGTYGNDGVINGRDQFATADAMTRVVDASQLLKGNATIGGEYGQDAAYDAAKNLITFTADSVSISNTTYPDAMVTAIALPVGATPVFDGGAAVPSGSSGQWHISIPAGTSAAVGVAMIARTGTVEDAVAAAKAQAVVAIKDPTADLATQHQWWDDYLARVPAAQDYSLHGVDTDGVTADQIRSMYYLGWVTLEMNVMPATPETGNKFASVGTGMASLYDTGTIGVSNSASWDSLLGAQQLVHVDPENAWQTFEGMMALVAPDGKLAGESLPSRKAQTAWILYQATGDKNRLAAVYDPLARHMRWEEENMRWMSTDHDETDEVDSEFTASLYYDLAYAEKISRVLGKTADAEEWVQGRTRLAATYQDLFFPEAGRDRGFTTVQKVYLDTSRTSAPAGITVFKDPATGRWTDAGHQFYTSTAMVVDQLDAQHMGWVVDRFNSEYDANRQFAGLARVAQKAPDAQLVTYGLLSRGDSDRAATFINATIRDTVLSKWFAEVYREGGSGRDKTPQVSGVRPSIFGVTNLIEDVWINNGYRMDQGDVAAIRLDSTHTGGISGLSHGGTTFDIDLVDGGVALSGLTDSGCRFIALTASGTAGLDGCVGDQAAITVNPSSVVQGGEVEVTGAGFVPKDEIALRWSNGASAGAVVADANGAFVLKVTAPADAGSYHLESTGAYSTASIDVTVTKSDVPDPGDGGTDPGDGGTGTGGTQQPPSGTDKGTISITLTKPAKGFTVGKKASVVVRLVTNRTWTGGWLDLQVASDKVRRIYVPANKVATVTVPARTRAGSVAIRGSFAGSEKWNATSNTVVVRVVKAKARLKVSAKRKHGSHRAKIAIRVKKVGGVSVAGKLTVRVDGRKATKARIGRSGKVTVSVRAAANARHKVIVRYKGNAGYSAAKKSVKFRL
ncbi:hypothetical protein [Rarobacter incanus]|uniref:alpha-L-rhamnosidase-related protein n=1 Tax=Rarobacter incanus TaxID=153494 RepID=UPI00115300E9|nr:hypothetical protein [Rarobacter incanus]